MTGLLDKLSEKLHALLRGSVGSNATLLFAESKHTLVVSRFSVDEGLSQLFHAEVTTLSEDASIDLDDLVGKGAALVLQAGGAAGHLRVWAGICTEAEQLRGEGSHGGISTYSFRLAPALWRASMRTNLRIFQHQSVPDIASAVLEEWGITPVLELKEEHPKLEYKVQYEESDLAFLERILQEEGITYFFRQATAHGHGADITRLVLADQPQAGAKREAPLPYVGHGATFKGSGDHAASGTLTQSVRHGKVTLRDHDFLQPAHKPMFTTATGTGPAQAKEAAYEDYRYVPGAGWVEGGAGGNTPVADQLGVARTSDAAAKALATRLLDAGRATRDVVTFETNAGDVTAGMVLSIGHELNGKVHPHASVAPDHPVLLTHVTIRGGAHEELSLSGSGVFADVPYRPVVTATKPRIWGLQSALVVGPPGSEIHTDEHGRIKVQFHWDREGAYDAGASCWMRVSQPWAGGGYGFFSIPRVGHEVLVSFFDGDPDRPVVVGGLHNVTNPAPLPLPAEMATSVWRSQSTPSPSPSAQPGYNEIAFKDDWGHELLNVQAQRDLQTVVKHDERRDVGNDRTTVVGKKDVHHVGESYTLTVGSGVTVTVDAHKRVVITTGGATVTLDDDSISLHASGQILVAAGGGLTLSSTGGSVKVDGPMVYLNCGSPTAATPVGAGESATPAQGATLGGPPYHPEAKKPEAEPLAPLADVEV